MRYTLGALSLVALLAISCTGSDFAGDATTPTTGAPGTGDQGPPATFTPGVGGDDPTGIAPTEQLPTTEGEIAQRRTECWFAVSGTYMGAGMYSDTFPNTRSGAPIGHGQQFDTVGGVFLQARPEPYVYQQGNRELDSAVTNTFDSIAVAPGMHAVIKTATGQVLADKQGPYFALSSEYGDREGITSNALAYYRANMSRYPAWLQQIIQSGVIANSRILLQSARSVQVSAIEGQRCDFQ